MLGLGDKAIDDQPTDSEQQQQYDQDIDLVTGLGSNRLATIDVLLLL